jgi:hypothetical protein
LRSPMERNSISSPESAMKACATHRPRPPRVPRPAGASRGLAPRKSDASCACTQHRRMNKEIGHTADAAHPYQRLMFFGEGDIGKDLSLGSRCNHRHPLLVTYSQTGRRARCMGCGKEGPVCASLSEAMRALRSAPVGMPNRAYPSIAAG